MTLYTIHPTVAFYVIVALLLIALGSLLLQIAILMYEERQR